MNGDPSPIADSRSGEGPPPAELVKEVAPNAASLDMLAGLVAMTDAELTELDNTTVDGSNNIAAKKWNPEAILQQHMDEGKAAGTIPDHGPPAGTSRAAARTARPPVDLPPQMPMAPAQNYAAHQVPVTSAFITDPQILERLDRIESILSTLVITYEQIAKNLLKSTTKQITIKFDDLKDTKQK